jgi:hypothetical protein
MGAYKAIERFKRLPESFKLRFLKKDKSSNRNQRKGTGICLGKGSNYLFYQRNDIPLIGEPLAKVYFCGISKDKKRASPVGLC